MSDLYAITCVLFKIFDLRTSGLDCHSAEYPATLSIFQATVSGYIDLQDALLDVVSHLRVIEESCHWGGVEDGQGGCTKRT